MVIERKIRDTYKHKQTNNTLIFNKNIYIFLKIKSYLPIYYPFISGWYVQHSLGVNFLLNLFLLTVTHYLSLFLFHLQHSPANFFMFYKFTNSPLDIHSNRLEKIIEIWNLKFKFFHLINWYAMLLCFE